MGVKAFELVPAIERLKLMADKAQTRVECIECCGKNLYIGTSDCFVVHYVMEETIQPNGKVMYKCEKQGHKYLSLKKPVLQLKAASALNRIMVLCDNTLTMLNMFDLEPIVGGAKIKNATAFALNDNPVKSNPFSVEIGVALKKKYIQVYTITEDRMILQREVSIPEVPVALGMDGRHVCVATQQQYIIVNYETSHVQDLFPYENETTKPFVVRISKDEFLLSAPSALGMFATSSGISQRPPLQWSDNLVSVAYSHPYILALNDEFITVHSILDQQQKQSIPFQGGQYLGEFDGRPFVASSKEIYALAPIAIDKQIQALLADQKVSEALDLAKNARKTGISRDKFNKMFQRIQQQAGFIEFQQRNLDQARELFHGGKLDVRELITLYPLLMPRKSAFTRDVPPLHEIADITQISQGDAEKIKQYKMFLLSYLEDIRGTPDAHGCAMEIDTALLKLYSETSSPDLVSFIVSSSACDVEDCEGWLQKYGHHHAMALLHKYRGDNDKALAIWIRLMQGELKDECFPGIEFIVEFLANLNDQELVWKYVDFVLEKDEILGVKVFSERPAGEPSSERLRPHIVVDYLARFPRAVIVYLEYLIFTKKLEKEKYHTHLAVLYLDRVLTLMKQPNSDSKEIDKGRGELQYLLQTSRLYRVQLILGKVRETELYLECAILYGKLEEHDKALRILVNKVRDYHAAENYCIINSKGKDQVYRKRLFQSLLSVYLDPSNEKRDSMVGPAVTLLNKNQGDFDVIKVLQVIPDNWSVGLLSQFLGSAVRKSMNNGRTARIERMLARGENLIVKKECIATQKETVSMTEEKACAVCGRALSDPNFVRYPNGVITHIQCAKNKQVCPVTGKLFSTKK